MSSSSIYHYAAHEKVLQRSKFVGNINNQLANQWQISLATSIINQLTIPSQTPIEPTNQRILKSHQSISCNDFVGACIIRCIFFGNYQRWRRSDNSGIQTMDAWFNFLDWIWRSTFRVTKTCLVAVSVPPIAMQVLNTMILLCDNIMRGGGSSAPLQSKRLKAWIS